LNEKPIKKGFFACTFGKDENFYKTISENSCFNNPKKHMISVMEKPWGGKMNKLVILAFIIVLSLGFAGCNTTSGDANRVDKTGLIEPLKPHEPLKPLEPLTPLKPLEPLKPITQK